MSLDFMLRIAEAVAESYRSGNITRKDAAKCIRELAELWEEKGTIEEKKEVAAVHVTTVDCAGNLIDGLKFIGVKYFYADNNGNLVLEDSDGHIISLFARGMWSSASVVRKKAND